MNVFWTKTAEDNLDFIFSYVAQSSPFYAKRLIDKITRKSIQISEFPLSGRIVPEIAVPQIREVFEGNYRIIYFIRPQHIEVIAVIHSLRLFPGKRPERL
jgi:plasmid stabilization system protein ParE